MKKLKHLNYYGFDHKVAYKKLNVVKYLGDSTIKGFGGTVWSIYYSKKPDRSKSHKDYVFLCMRDEALYINGKNKDELGDVLKVDGVYCKKCEDVIYSAHVHDFHYCHCGAVAVDGGREYLKICGDLKDYNTCKINLATGRVKLDK